MTNFQYITYLDKKLKVSLPANSSYKLKQNWYELPADSAGIIQDCWEVDIETLRQKGLAYYRAKAELFRQQKFEFAVNAFDELTSTTITVNVLTDMTKDTLSDWVLVYIAGTNMAHVVRADNGLDDYINVSDEEIARVRAFLAQRLKEITLLDVKITNKIKTASEQLILAVFLLEPLKLDTFTTTIMQNAQSILQMTEEQFDSYILQILQD